MSPFHGPMRTHICAATMELSREAEKERASIWGSSELRGYYTRGLDQAAKAAPKKRKRPDKKKKKGQEDSDSDDVHAPLHEEVCVLEGGVSVWRGDHSHRTHRGGGRAGSLYATPPPRVLKDSGAGFPRENCPALKAPICFFILCVYTQNTQNFVEP